MRDPEQVPLYEEHFNVSLRSIQKVRFENKIILTFDIETLNPYIS